MIPLPSAPTRDPDAALPPMESKPAFAEVYELHFPFVWRSVRRLGIPDHAVDDVTQEVFVVVYRRLAEFEGRSTLKTWLFGIVLRVVRSHRRALLKKNPHMLQAGPNTDLETLSDPRAQGPHELASKSEAALLVHRLLDSLDDEKREVFVLAELEEMTGPDIAAALDLNLNTVYSRLRLAREEFAAAAARYRSNARRTR